MVDQEGSSYLSTLYPRASSWPRKRQERLLQLYRCFQEFNYELKTHGDQYLFITCGHPDLDTVMKQEHQRCHQYQQRRLELTRVLTQAELSYDEDFPICREYVQGQSRYELNEVVRAVELEIFLRQKTNFLRLCPQMGRELAQEIALQQYLRASEEAEPLEEILETPVTRLQISFD